jgi:hypothetical protein
MMVFLFLYIHVVSVSTLILSGGVCLIACFRVKLSVPNDPTYVRVWCQGKQIHFFLLLSTFTYTHIYNMGKKNNNKDAGASKDKAKGKGKSKAKQPEVGALF